MDKKLGNLIISVINMTLNIMEVDFLIRSSLGMKLDKFDTLIN